MLTPMAGSNAGGVPLLPASLFPPLTVCDHCANLFGSLEISTKIFSNRNESDGYEYRRTRRYFESSAARGCLFCQGRLAPWIDLYRTNNQWEWGKILQEPRPSNYPAVDEELSCTVRYNKARSRLSFRWRNGINERTRRNDFSRVVYTTQNDPSSQVISKHVEITERDSPEAFALTNRWMQQCEANHQDCHQTSPLQAPTRLIEVSSIGEPLAARLHVSAQNSGNYLALSYCWGGPQRHALIGSKVSEYCISLPYSELPNTILDSFEVTRQLKYRYIWIDSLCMIQDDREDMLRELPKMNLIYRNADQTISVACASSCDEGFLKSRHNGLYRVPLRTNKDVVGSLLIGEGTSGWTKEKARLQPINERAWTLQESLLARRLLIFPGSGVYWKCDTICQSDTSSKPQSWEFVAGRLGYQRESVEWPIPEATLFRSQQSHEYFYPAMLGEAWSRAVEGYSMRHLSFEGDKLAAISAIAANMSILFRCGYLAGLWRDDLVNGLAWEIYRSPEMPAIVHRTQSYQAPSWSWASITGPISFPEQHRRAIHKPAAEIELCDTSLVSERLPYGAVSAGTLIIRGYVNEVMIGSTENTMTTILDITLAQPTKTYMRLNLDDPSDQKLNTFLLLILFSESGIAVPKKTKAGLVLTKSSDENAVHRRVGWFDSFNESGPLAGDQWSQRVVTII